MAAERTLCDITEGLLETFATLACVTPALQEQELGFWRLAWHGLGSVRWPAAEPEFWRVATFVRTADSQLLTANALPCPERCSSEMFIAAPTSFRTSSTVPPSPAPIAWCSPATC